MRTCLPTHVQFHLHTYIRPSMYTCFISGVDVPRTWMKDIKFKSETVAGTPTSMDVLEQQLVPDTQKVVFSMRNPFYR